MTDDDILFLTARFGVMQAHCRALRVFVEDFKAAYEQQRRLSNVQRRIIWSKVIVMCTPVAMMDMLTFFRVDATEVAGDLHRFGATKDDAAGFVNATYETGMTRFFSAAARLVSERDIVTRYPPGIIPRLIATYNAMWPAMLVGVVLGSGKREDTIAVLLRVVALTSWSSFAPALARRWTMTSGNICCNEPCKGSASFLEVNQSLRYCAAASRCK